MENNTARYIHEVALAASVLGQEKYEVLMDTRHYGSIEAHDYLATLAIQFVNEFNTHLPEYNHDETITKVNAEYNANISDWDELVLWWAHLKIKEKISN